ncbi:hypothetical protein [Mucilaginibacter sp. L3T2-6]|uniref:hypothetical protein n=1 Tax=Mucilaginibacter sp. L3T2-6 TaxID=3062491 RepID=UPI00267603C1|nr:hypothetical protein [Mucilaginibacter sp. L3T2-6]MDO3643839.1 hypothetical protein [Mucilaginibacter sp. L3T2-6]MDV6216290.1 hypothetical protein [Mucilaginibacter sp. L3T2-6]
MKELKEIQHVGPILEAHFPLSRPRGKRWKTAQTRGSNPAQARQNECTEFAYHEVLNLVKMNYMQAGEVYFEKDFKHDKDPKNFLAMHSFLSLTFYWRLDCAAYYDYEIEFAFHECPFEEEVRKLFRAFPLERQAKEKVLQPNFKMFYRLCIEMMDPKFIFCFKR